MKKFIIKSTIFLFITLGAVANVNYFGDAANLYEQNYEYEIAAILKNGKNVTNISNFNDRILRKIQITEFRKRSDMVVLGSSRMMLIGKETCGARNLRNSSVSGASMEDLIAIYQIYKKENILPKKFIIGIDPWIFNKNNGQDRWQVLSEYYCSFGNMDCNLNPTVSDISQIVSPSYFQSSLRYLLLNQSSQPLGTKNEYNQTNTILLDGSLVYNKEMRDRSNEEITNSIKTFLSKDIYGLRNFSNPSSIAIKKFELFLLDILQSGINMELILIPYPPNVYEVIRNENKAVIEVERILYYIAENNNIKIKGSYNPQYYKFDNFDFYDGMHLKPEGVKKIMNEIF